MKSSNFFRSYFGMGLKKCGRGIQAAPTSHLLARTVNPFGMEAALSQIHPSSCLAGPSHCLCAPEASPRRSTPSWPVWWKPSALWSATFFSRAGCVSNFFLFMIWGQFHSKNGFSQHSCLLLRTATCSHPTAYCGKLMTRSKGVFGGNAAMVVGIKPERLRAQTSRPGKNCSPFSFCSDSFLFFHRK